MSTLDVLGLKFFIQLHDNMFLVKLQFGAGHLRFSVSHPRASIATSSISVREMQPHKLACARARASRRAKKGLAWHLSASKVSTARSRINRRPRPPERIYIFADRRIIYPGRDYFVAGACEQKGNARRETVERGWEDRLRAT